MQICPGMLSRLSNANGEAHHALFAPQGSTGDGTSNVQPVSSDVHQADLESSPRCHEAWHIVVYQYLQQSLLAHVHIMYNTARCQ